MKEGREEGVLAQGLCYLNTGVTWCQEGVPGATLTPYYTSGQSPLLYPSSSPHMGTPGPVPPSAYLSPFLPFVLPKTSPAQPSELGLWDLIWA